MIIFDDEYFIPQVEGNLNIPADAYLREPYDQLKIGGRSWPSARISQASLMSNPQIKAMSMSRSCTLNSFAAFSDYGDMQLGNGVTYDTASGTYWNADGDQISVEEAGLTMGSPVPSSPTSPAAATTSNKPIDILSGIIKAFTPVAVAAVSPSVSNSPAGQAAMMQLYLKGQLPGYTIDPRTGKLVRGNPATSTPSATTMLIIAGVGVLAFVMLAGGKRK